MNHYTESLRDWDERKAYAHTDIQLRTEEEFAAELEWIAGFAGEDDATAVMRAVREICVDRDICADCSEADDMEIYIYFFNRDEHGDECPLYCEIVVYR